MDGKTIDSGKARMTVDANLVVGFEIGLGCGVPIGFGLIALWIYLFG